MRTAAIEGVNRRYRDVPDVISQKFAQRGYGSSGALQSKMWDTELSRLGDIGTTNANYADMVRQQGNYYTSLAERLLASSQGVNSTQTDPGNVAGGSTTAGLQMLMMLMGMGQGSKNDPYAMFKGWE